MRDPWTETIRSVRARCSIAEVGLHPYPDLRTVAEIAEREGVPEHLTYMLQHAGLEDIARVQGTAQYQRELLALLHQLSTDYPLNNKTGVRK